ncbi:MATH/TRAF domain [Arabidopsis suecica]|uniref:MATH/TRAF domain n=1 Tax=Arabidopsis suecica TaxID=45249 RepID=A0A8T2FHF1_ARASU|nr:MATH/TRAF domain [Arabidopsis suecica]
MGKQINNTFTWVIKNLSTLQGLEVRSKIFVVGGCKWRLIAYPEVNDADGYLSLSVYLGVPDCCESLPSGWKRHAKFSLTIVNQLSEGLSQVQETQAWFDENAPGWGFPPMLNLKDVSDKYGGFLVNDEVMVAVAVDVIEVVGSLDAPEMSESMDIKGFKVLPSQVKSVNRLFESHPDIASKFSIKNQSLKTAYMNVLLCLAETLHQSPMEISEDDLSDAKTTLAYMKSVGFKLDWLEKKLDELFEKKKEEADKIRMQNIEEELKDLRQKCSSLEALLKKEKTGVLAAKAPFLFFNNVNDDDLKWILRAVMYTVIMMLFISI